MIINAAPRPYTEYKLYRTSVWDAFQFKGKLPSGKWQTIYSAVEINPYYTEMLLVNYGIDIHTIPQITKGN